MAGRLPGNATVAMEAGSFGLSDAQLQVVADEYHAHRDASGAAHYSASLRHMRIFLDGLAAGGDFRRVRSWIVFFILFSPALYLSFDRRKAAR